MEVWIILLIVLGVLLLIAVGVAGAGAASYNGLVRKRVATDNAWSQIDVQLKRRYDLIPNLVETVQGYASHEHQTLTEVTRARQTAVDAGTVEDQAEAETRLTGALRRLFVASESYPDLKANQNFQRLQEELTATENKIAYARQYYNDTVSQYTTASHTFPGSIFAGMFHFPRRDFFEIEDDSHREAPQVDFS